MLCGEKVTLIISTKELWHKFYENYVKDPMMDTTPYKYDFAAVEKLYYSRTADPSRLYFSIINNEKVVGQIYLKHMDKEKQSTEFGIALINDAVKGKGFGTEAINLLIDYTFSVLGYSCIIADSVLRNTRSQHILQKAGFIYTHEDEIFKYYRLDKSCPAL